MHLNFEAGMVVIILLLLCLLTLFLGVLKFFGVLLITWGWVLCPIPVFVIGLFLFLGAFAFFDSL